MGSPFFGPLSGDIDTAHDLTKGAKSGNTMCYDMATR